MLGALGASVPGDTGAALLGELRLELGPARALFEGVELSVLHDVDVPLCGPDGAAVLFGPQKGLRREDVEPFDRALARLGEAFGGDIAERAGAGAAGGLGAALYALGAGARSGSEAVIELVGLRRSLAGAALCLTAEGSVDRQSAHGKTVAGVLAACRDAGVPCIVLGGRVSEDATAPLRALGALDVRAIGPAQRPLAEALAAASSELAAAAESAVRNL
jgi:glycerate kinase